jgi:prevent-host-death family protein
MVQVNMHEAKTRLSQLVELVEDGERVVIARDGTPVVELVRLDPAHVNRRGGQWKGKASIADDFDAPLPELEELFGS